MTRRLSTVVIAASMAIVIAACGGGATGPALTDPTEIVKAALKSTEAAKSVHLEIAIDGKANIELPGGIGAGAPIDLTGTTASADIDFANSAAKVTFAVPKLFGFGGELIAVDDKVYIKTTITGPKYMVSAASDAPVNPGDASGMIDNLGDLLLKDGVVLVKGDDAQCGTEQCYTVTTELTAETLGTSKSGPIPGLPVDLTGASLKITILVEKDLPYHLAGVTAVMTLSSDTSITAELTASKWDEPVTIKAPPLEQQKPA